VSHLNTTLSATNAHYHFHKYTRKTKIGYTKFFEYLICECDFLVCMRNPDSFGPDHMNLGRVLGFLDSNDGKGHRL
jgi:hypothetical protein